MYAYYLDVLKYNTINNVNNVGMIVVAFFIFSLEKFNEYLSLWVQVLQPGVDIQRT